MCFGSVAVRSLLLVRPSSQCAARVSAAPPKTRLFLCLFTTRILLGWSVQDRPKLTLILYSEQLVLGSFLGGIVCSPKKQTAVDCLCSGYRCLY